MPIQTQIKFKDFIKAVKIFAIKKFANHKILNKNGSARRIELFKGAKDTVPVKMWVVHESKYLYSEDFKKTYTNLGVSKEEFLELLDSF